MSGKTYTDTDIPDDVMNRAALALATCQVKEADMQSPQRLVARGMLLQQEAEIMRVLDQLAPPKGVRN